MAYTTIDKPSDYFETLLSTGDGGSQTFTGLDFQPDFVWSKRRQAHVHQLYDSVRTAGSGKAIQSDSNAAEGGDGGTYGYLSSFTSDGFASTVGSSNNNYFNADGATYVFWNWKAGTSFTNDASSTSVGSVDTAGSVNTDAGFSIMKYTGVAGEQTIAHGLGAVPKMIWVKNLDSTENWRIYHHSIGAGGYLKLNTTDATTDDTGPFSNTTPTSSVITMGGDDGTMHANEEMIAYIFAEKQGYSSISQYKGNGNANGPFIYTGFKPAFIMIRGYAGTDDWIMVDNKRSGYNPENEHLDANNNAAESDGSGNIDFLSNGFKIKSTFSSMNYSTGKYIYIAFAENPFVTSTGVPGTGR